MTYVGPAGCGKTALLRTATAAAADPAVGATVLRLRGVEAEADLPWAALAGLCLPFEHVFERLPGAQSRALRTALALDESTEPVDRLAVSLGALGVVSAAARSAPVAIFVDDLQWVDPESRAALGFVARRLADDPAVIVATSRDHAAVAGPALEVGRLPDADLDQILADRGVVSSAAREAVVAVAGGNPLVAIGVAARLAEAVRVGTRPVPAQLPVPAALVEIYSAQLEELAEPARHALLLLAADTSDQPAVVAAALAAAGLGLGDLEQAEANGLVVVESGRVGFAHPLARSAAYERATAPDRRSAHQTLGAAETDADRALLHRAAAAIGPDEGLADALAAQAVDASRRGAPLVAAARWSAAATMTADGRRRSERLVAGSGAALVGGEHRWAASLLAASAGDGGAPPSFDARRIEIRLAVQDGRIEDARRLAEEGDLALSATDPVGAAQLLVEVARPVVAREPARALAIIERIWELAGDAPPPAGLYAEILYGWVAFLNGDVDAAARHVERWPELLAAEGAVVAGAFVADTVVPYYLYAGRVPAALELLDQLESAMRVACAPAGLLAVMASRCLVTYSTNLRACVSSGREARDLAAEAGQAGIVTVVNIALAVAAAAVGDAPLTEQVAGELLAAGGPTEVTMARAALAKLALVENRPGAAVAEFERLREVIGSENPTMVQFEADEAEALVRVGRLDDAAALLVPLDTYAAYGGWGVGMAQRVRALLATDVDEADACFAASREALASGSNRVALGTTELLWGQRLRRSKRKAEARRHLTEAIDLFRGVGADGLRKRAEEELAAAGGTLDRSRPTTDLLSALELQVARLAVGGATNRDIAGQLFISPRTVENHLGAVYRKLGVGGRSGLVARAATDDALGSAS